MKAFSSISSIKISLLPIMMPIEVRMSWAAFEMASWCLMVVAPRFLIVLQDKL